MRATLDTIRAWADTTAAAPDLGAQQPDESPVSLFLGLLPPAAYLLRICTSKKDGQCPFKLLLLV